MKLRKNVVYSGDGRTGASLTIRRTRLPYVVLTSADLVTASVPKALQHKLVNNAL